MVRQEAILLGTRKTEATAVKRRAAKLSTYADIRSGGVTAPAGFPDSAFIWVVALIATQVCVAVIDANTGDIYNASCEAGSDWPPWFKALKDRAP